MIPLREALLDWLRELYPWVLAVAAVAVVVLAVIGFVRMS